MPPDGASNVPTNTPLFAIYELGATHNGEFVRITPEGSDAEDLAATYRSGTKKLLVSLPSSDIPDPDPPFPNGELRPNTKYTVTWPGLSTGGTRPRRGDGATVTFTVGATRDDSLPKFAGATGVIWDFEREFDNCSDTESERYLFKLSFGAPSYSGGEGLLSVIAFQTQGPTLNRDDNGRPAPEEVHTQRYTGKNTVTVTRPVADAVGKACFSVMMAAPSGLPSGGREKEVCTTTERPPFFDGCQLSSHGRPTRSPLFIGMLLVLGAGRLRRSVLRSRHQHS
jgi:hypothetical protein